MFGMSEELQMLLGIAAVIFAVLGGAALIILAGAH